MGGVLVEVVLFDYYGGIWEEGGGVRMPLWQSPWMPRPARRVREGTGVLEKLWVGERARAWMDMVVVGLVWFGWMWVIFLAYVWCGSGVGWWLAAFGDGLLSDVVRVMEVVLVLEYGNRARDEHSLF